jgi:3-hydroxyacyl-CoA dehydrogenase / enoyl-CoA hydratase / 3-hydroxybutyryl-CoA epimerase
MFKELFSTHKTFKVVAKTTSQGEIGILEFDLANEKANKWNTQTMTEFRDLLKEIAKTSFKAIVITSKKPKIYIAGADIDEIKSLQSKDDFMRAVLAGHEIFNQLEDLAIPTYASIHGACMGGGCEMIIACDYRIASEANETRIGLPETKLGIIPGFGGCVRLPRMVGLQASLDIILAGKAVNAKKAQKMGLVDRVVHPSILFDQTIRFVEDNLKEGKGKRQKTYRAQGLLNKFLESPIGKPVVFSQARKGVQKLTHGHYPAPFHAIDVISKTYGMNDRAKAMEIEREGFCLAAMTDVSKNLIHVFNLTEMVKRSSGVSNTSVKGKDVKSMGILGAGTMGGGIAYTAADKGVDVRMKDISLEAVAKGIKHARDLWQKLVKKKVINKYELEQRIDRVTGGVDYAGFKAMDLCVEAIVEDMEIKKKVIAETAKNMREDAIIATNTSSLSVTEMSAGHPRPEFFAGMHFFNPVDKMPLVEVIRGSKSSDETIATVYELSKKMGKMPVVVKDGPGFLVNRLLLPYMAEAAFLMQEGMSIDVVDRAYVKEFGMPMGPFALMDEVGLDVCMKVLKIFKKAFGDRIEIAPLMDKLEKSGKLGKKNGQGFYKYENGRRGEVDSAIYSTLGLPEPKNPYTSKECIERGVFAMVNEASRALIEDKIVETPHEVDLAMIMGTGFAPFRGGLMKYADSLGSSYVCDQLEIYAAKNASRLRPSPQLKDMAKNNSKFY